MVPSVCRSGFAIALLTAAWTLTPTTVAAQAAGDTPTTLADARWAPWIGCWRSVDDPAATGARICVTPAEQGVRLTTIIGGQKVRDELRIADGTNRPVTGTDCRGTDSTKWSTRALRVYRSASVECESDGPRTLHTASFLLAGPTWVDVETVTSGADTNVRVTRLVHAHNQQLADGTTVAPAAVAPPTGLARVSQWTVDDVIELSAELPQDGVQAAVSEAPAPFRLNAKALIAMADAGVGDRVIDLIVGITYPQKFVVQRMGGGGGGGGLDPYGFGLGTLAFDPFFAPLVGPAALMNCYSPYGWARASYWSSCASVNPYYATYPGYYAGYYDPWGVGWIQTQGGGGNGSSGVPAAEGRVVNGRGYTQVRPVDPLPILGGGSGSGWSGTSSSGSSGGSSGSSGVSSGGYSGGGGGGGGGDRMAVPRPPGN